MKPEFLQRAPTGLRLAVIAWLAAIPAVTYGQQTITPDAVSLEEEVEEIRQYTVELIVFEYAERAAGSELFLPDPPPEEPEPEDLFEDLPAEPIVFDDTSVLLPVDGEPEIPEEEQVLAEIPTYEQQGLSLVDPEEYLLGDVYRKLVELDAYRPLLHTAWTQATPEQEDTLPIKLRRLGDPPLRLEGTVQLYLSRYLHLVMDLSLEEKSAQRMPQERVTFFGDDRTQGRFGYDFDFLTPTIHYRIQEDRIVRNGELRYYDHPKFGVLAKITRVEEEDPDDAEEPADTLLSTN